jgi:hypothetical protein
LALLRGGADTSLSWTISVLHSKKPEVPGLDVGPTLDDMRQEHVCPADDGPLQVAVEKDLLQGHVMTFLMAMPDREVKAAD